MLLVEKPSKDSRHPDYVPSVFSFHKSTHKSTSSGLARLDRAQQRCKHQASSDNNQKAKQPRRETTAQPDIDTACNITGNSAIASTTAEGNNNLVCVPTFQSSETCTNDEDANNGTEAEDSSQQPYSALCCCESMQQILQQSQSECHRLALLNAELESKSKALEVECAKLKSNNIVLQSNLNSAVVRVSQIQFGANMILSDDEKTCFYTGLPTYQVFETLFSLLQSSIATGIFVNEGKNKDQFFATLVKLRQNVLLTDLAYRLNVTESTVSRFFHKWLNVMYINLKQLVIWPDKETLQYNLPCVFQGRFRQVRCIIDCFEIFIERPLSFTARALTYSNYKKHNTVKVLIAVSPTGSIAYISAAWGGRVSDKVITQQCGFLNFIDPGDVVLADRGFNVQDDIAIKGGKLEIPAFTRGKQQLSREEVERSRQLARVRIHVERVIGQMRKKYSILNGTLPITLLKKSTDTTITTVDKILVVCAALTNLSRSVV